MTLMQSSSKIKEEHLRRKAVVYVRQSTLIPSSVFTAVMP